MITTEQVNRMRYEELEILRDKARKHRCPTCDAPPGSGCAFLPGLAYNMRAYHLARLQQVSDT